MILGILQRVTDRSVNARVRFLGSVSPSGEPCPRACSTSDGLTQARAELSALLHGASWHLGHASRTLQEAWQGSGACREDVEGAGTCRVVLFQQHPADLSSTFSLTDPAP